MSEHTEQPLPTRNDRPSIQGLVREDLEQRERIGRERYGTSLQALNSRDGLRDLYEELLDATCYVRQVIAERDLDGEAWAQVAELQRQNVRQRDLLAELRRQVKALEKQLPAAQDGVQ